MSATASVSQMPSALDQPRLPSRHNAINQLQDQLSPYPLRPVSKYEILVGLQKFGRFLLPSFARPLLHVEKDRDGEKEVLRTRHDTEYLDGLRGFAAISVSMLHFLMTSYPRMSYGYGYNGENWYFTQLPIIRIAYSGPTMVAIFFIVSGFALSAKGIQLMRDQSHIASLQALSSSTFRRSFRLFLPSFASAFLAFVFQRLGLLAGDLPPGYVSSWRNDTVNFLWFLRRLFDAWSLTPHIGWYNGPLWTIPIEFRGSMVVYLVLMGLSRSQMRVRLVVELAGALYALWCDRWEVILFLWGMFLAELHFHRKERSSEELLHVKDVPWTKLDDAADASPKPSILIVILYVALVLGLYLGSFPRENGNKTPGFMWLSSLDWHQESWRYFSGYGAMLILTSISFLPACQRLFTTPLSQYAGRISFALYLTHELVIRVFILRFQKKVWAVIGKESVLGYHGGVLIAAIIYVFSSIWAADVFWRAIDIPSVNLARWFEEKSVDRRRL